MCGRDVPRIENPNDYQLQLAQDTDCQKCQSSHVYKRKYGFFLSVKDALILHDVHSSDTGENRTDWWGFLHGKNKYEQYKGKHNQLDSSWDLAEKLGMPSLIVEVFVTLFGTNVDLVRPQMIDVALRLSLYEWKKHSLTLIGREIVNKQRNKMAQKDEVMSDFLVGMFRLVGYRASPNDLSMILSRSTLPNNTSSAQYVSSKCVDLLTDPQE